MDVAHAEGDRVLELAAPEQLYDIVALLRDAERYVVESVGPRRSRHRARVVDARPPRKARPCRLRTVWQERSRARSLAQIKEPAMRQAKNQCRERKQEGA